MYIHKMNVILKYFHGNSDNHTKFQRVIHRGENQYGRLPESDLPVICEVKLIVCTAQLSLWEAQELASSELGAAAGGATVTNVNSHSFFASTS